MRAIILCLGVLAAAGFARPAAAVTDYDACLGLIETDLDRALSESEAWARIGQGGVLARHCYALALLAKGAPLSAADELMAAAAEEPGLTNTERANLMVQAGEILLEAGEDLSPAIVAEQAISLAPKSASAIGLRAAVKLSADNYAGALNDLDDALTIGGPNASLLALRAAARLKLGRNTSARGDAVWATELDPELPEAWLQRGLAEAALKDRHSARQSFLTVIKLARGTTLARAAQVALQKMDAGSDS